MEFQKLTVYSYDEDLKKESRVTLSPMNIDVVNTGIDDVLIRGLSLRSVAILFSAGNTLELLMNYSDLELLEKAVGLFCVEE